MNPFRTKKPVRRSGPFIVDFGIPADPHGAVGWLALNRWLEQHPGQAGIFLETAHPVKFPDTVEKFTGESCAIPEPLKELFGKKKNSVPNGTRLFEFLRSTFLGLRHQA